MFLARVTHTHSVVDLHQTSQPSAKATTGARSVEAGSWCG